MVFRQGDPVVVRVTKHSAKPGPRACEIDPQPAGEGYTYCVDKFWRVAEVRQDGHLVLFTRRGKRRLVTASDPQIRRAHWWERLLYGDRFPHDEQRG